MKWVVLAAMAFASVSSPIWLRPDLRRLSYVGFLIGFCPFFFFGDYHINMAIISWKDWPGYVSRGLRFRSSISSLSQYFLRFPRAASTPIQIVDGCVFSRRLLSVLQSDVPMASLFYCWQLFRTLFRVQSSLARACELSEFVDALLKGFGAAVIVEALLAGLQHFAFGVHQAAGTETSQNELGMLTDLVVFPVFALLLSGRSGGSRGRCRRRDGYRRFDWIARGNRTRRVRLRGDY